MYDVTKPYKADIAELIRSTWDTPWVEMDTDDTVYPLFRRKYQGYEVQHTDGIGTKGAFHYESATWAAAVQDALAMNLNDLLLVKARPVTLQNHIMLQHDEHDVILFLVEQLASMCRERQIAMTGGETSILGNLTGMDMSITVTGVVESTACNESIIGNVILGIPSSGVHSNGFTQVKALLPRIDGITPRGQLYANLKLLTPTRMYWDDLYKHVPFIDGMMHITGGAWTKLLDILHPAHDMVIGRWKPQDVFRKLHRAWECPDEDMYKTFNCGMGFVICVCKDYAKVILDDIEDAKVIGEVVPGNGRVVIESAFSSKEIVYE